MTTAVGEQRPEARSVRTESDLDREIKFTIDGRDVTAVRRWLQSVCRSDPAFPAGVVCTIYYDTLALHHLREKVNSDYLKTKLRLRWYEDQTESQARSLS